MIVQPDTVPGQPQRRDGIQETCRQTSQSAVSEGRFRLRFLNLRQFLPILFQNPFQFLINSQIDQIIGQKLSDQKLRRNIIKLLLPRDLLRDLGHLLRQLQNGIIELRIRTVSQPLPILLLRQHRKLRLHIKL